MEDLLDLKDLQTSHSPHETENGKLTTVCRPRLRLGLPPLTVILPLPMPQSPQCPSYVRVDLNSPI